MGLRIVYGKAGSGKSEFCYQEIAKKLNSTENVLIITPEQFSFTAEKKLMQVAKKNAVINAEVITLSRMAHRLVNEKKQSLTKSGKAMLMYSVIEKNKQKLKFLGKSSENVDLSIQAITEFKKHKISLDLINEKLENMEDEYLKTKLNDMKIIYEEFEKQIEDKFLDDTDLLAYLENNIDEKCFINNSIIYVDEFMGFTKQEYAVIAKLVKYAKQVTITLCIDSLKLSATPVSDIFYSNKQTLSKLLYLLEENNLKLEEPVEMAEVRRFKNEELQVLEQNIFAVNSTIYAKNVENIELFLAKNQYSEVEKIANQITKLVKEKNYRYREIAIITKNLSGYSNLIRAIFSKYEIPVFIDEKRDLNQNVIIKYILALLDVLSKNYSLENVVNYIKTGFLDIDNEDIFKLENYCKKWGIKYNKWKKDFIYEKQENGEEVERLNELRKEIIEPLDILKKDLKEQRFVEEKCKKIYEFLIQNNIEEKIENKYKELEEQGLIDLSKEYKKSYEIVINILDDISKIFKGEELTIEKFSDYFRIGLRNSSLGKIPGTQDQVIVGDVERSRSNKIKALFIIGVNDGIFPSNSKEEGFFNDADRENLKENGMEIAKGLIENLYEENFNIYKAFSTAEEKIYISYSSANSDGSSLRPSVIIIKLKKIFPKLQEKSDIITKEYEIANSKVTYEELLENIFMIDNKEEVDPIWYQIYKYYKKNNENLKNDLLGLKYTNLPKDIKQEIVDKLYGNTLNTSVSKLEKYRSCPFSYYLEYGLKLKEREELKVQGFNTGTLMHDTIDKFFKTVESEDIKLSQFIEDENLIEKLVSKIIDEELELNKNAIFTTTAKYQILVARLKRLVSKALKFIVEGIVYSEFSVKGTEISFGKSGEYKPITLDLEDGKRVEITGKIDRVDVAKTEDGNYLRIIDYKSSARNIDLNKVYAGLQIQLLTYLDAMCKQEGFIPAGVLYFSLLEQVAKSEGSISEEEIESQIRKNFKMKGLIVADVKIVKMHDTTVEEGSSNYVPAHITKSGNLHGGWTSGVSQEEFKLLQEYIFKTIKDISREILKGKIDLKPYNKKGSTPCKYCSYKAICGFDTKNCDNQYDHIPSKKAKEVIEDIKGAMK